MSMLNAMAMLLAGPQENYILLQSIRVTLLALMVVCSVFLIIVILLQPGNSAGVSAISGETETFLGKNKTKTKEGFFKKLTVVAVVLLTVFSICFFLINVLPIW